MRTASEKAVYIIGDERIAKGMQDLRAAIPFDDKIMAYLDRVAKALLKDAKAKRYPDVTTFAFWCRRASILGLRKPYEHMRDRIGRGLVFHIAPSNVPVNFAYSLATALLAGNANIVRVPSKAFEQVGIICEALKDALDNDMRPYVCLVRYGHSQSVTDFFSAMCDTRIIWGGDKTIAQIRRSPLKPRATEIAFADRYSICLINADEYLKTADKNQIAGGFYNDTYLTDQNACTSPKLVVWMGERVVEAQNVFWGLLHGLVKEKYTLQPIQAVNKHANMCRQAIKNSGLRLAEKTDNLITRIQAPNLSKSLIEDNGNSGYFIEYEARSWDEILPVCGLECQTLACCGIEVAKIRAFLMKYKPKGIDRVVAIGRTMDFSFVWDGYDLIHSLTRQVSI